MEQNEMDRFKKLLEDKREEILDEAERTLTEMTDQSGNIPDPNDRASAEADRSFELRIRDRERKLLPKIEAALERIKDGTFGECEGCGEEIGLKRLEARPVTSLCIDCKTLQEKKEKGHGAQGVNAVHDTE
jgi:DnaK suppressor protein